MIQFSITLVIIVITVLVSLKGFNDRSFTNKLIFYPYGMDRPSELYRFLTSGFIHGDIPHLAFNMFALYGFGQTVEAILGMAGYRWAFIVLYLTGLIVSSVPAYIKHRNHSHYSALGASGAVSAVLFACIYYMPWTGISFLGLEQIISIPGFVFAIAYLAYSSYMDKKGSDNIGHNQHLWGAVYGFIYAFCVDPTHGRAFIYQITHPVF